MGGYLLGSVWSRPAATVDEPGWISSGFLTWQLATSGAAHDRWAAAYEERDLHSFGHMNPPVGKYLIGAVVALVRDADDPVDYVWTWGRDYGWNLAAGNIPPQHVLTAARACMALAGTACLILVSLIAWELMPRGTWHPLVAAVLLFINPAFRHAATHVYSDVPQMCLSLTAVGLIIRWCRKQNAGVLLAGLVTVGLACATKFSAGPLAVLTGLAVCLVPAPLARRVCRATAAACIPPVVFVAVNPYLWRHPVPDTLGLMRQWTAYLGNQQADPALAARAVLDRWTASRLVFDRAFLLGIPGGQSHDWLRAGHVLVAAMAAFVGVAVLAAHVLSIRRSRSSGRSEALAIVSSGGLAGMLAGGVVSLRPLVAALPVAGATRVIRHVVRQRRCDGLGYFGIVFVGTVVATVLWLPFDWDRYYLPVVSLTPILAALGVMEFQDLVLRFHRDTWNRGHGGGKR